MSARVLNPMLMTDLSRGLLSSDRGGGGGGGSGSGSGRVIPTKAELAPIRRDLFGPVDHAANRALAERELRAQSRLDAERWGFDFHLGLPRTDARYAWEPVKPTDIVPEPYALRGMPYIRKHAPGTPRKLMNKNNSSNTSTRSMTVVKNINNNNNNNKNNNNKTLGDHESTVIIINEDIMKSRNAEMTPPQELRVPDIAATNRSCETTPEELQREFSEKNVIQQSIDEPTTPVLPVNARKQLGKQSVMTDFMKSRKRSLNIGSSSKSIIGEPPEKMSRNAGQIRS